MPKTVLIVEDDVDTRILYQRALSEQGYRVLTAPHGAEGVEVARSSRPDLILLDLDIPVMDGYEAMRHLHSDPDTAEIPICAVSSRVLAEKDLVNVETPALECCIQKSEGPAALLVAIEARIGAPAPPAPGLQENAPLVPDLRSSA